MLSYICCDLSCSPFRFSLKLALTRLPAQRIDTDVPSEGSWKRITRTTTSKMPSYQYRKAYCGDKTIEGPSCLHNGISYTGKMVYLYWIGVLVLLSVSDLCAKCNIIGIRYCIIRENTFVVKTGFFISFSENRIARNNETDPLSPSYWYDFPGIFQYCVKTMNEDTVLKLDWVWA